MVKKKHHNYWKRVSEFFIKSKWILNWAALIVSIITVYLLIQSNDRAEEESKRADQIYIQSSRPFVWVEDVIEYDSVLGEDVVIPYKADIYVRNSPAQISRFEIIFQRKSEIVYSESHNERKVLFPKSIGPNWNWKMKADQYKSFINPEKTCFTNPAMRIIMIDYSLLENDQVYHYKIIHINESKNRGWRMLYETSD